MDEYVLIRRDANGKVISAQPLEISSLTIESEGDASVHRFRIEGFYHPITREKRPPEGPMATGDEIIAKYYDPKLISRGE